MFRSLDKLIAYNILLFTDNCGLVCYEPLVSSISERMKCFIVVFLFWEQITSHQKEIHVIGDENKLLSGKFLQFRLNGYVGTNGILGKKGGRRMVYGSSITLSGIKLMNLGIWGLCVVGWLGFAFGVSIASGLSGPSNVLQLYFSAGQTFIINLRCRVWQLSKKSIEQQQ